MSGARKTLAPPTSAQRSNDPPETLLTVNETADILRLSPRHVRRIIALGELPVVRIGKAVRVRPTDLRRLIEGAR